MCRPRFRAGLSLSPPMLRRDVVVVEFSVSGVPWQKRRMLYGSDVPSAALELDRVRSCEEKRPVATYFPTMSRLIMPATLIELFLYVCARFSAPSKPCSSPAKAVKAIEVLGL